MSTDEVRRFRFAPILTATVLTVLLLWLVGTVADVLMLLFLGVLLALYLNALADTLHRRLHVPQHLSFISALLASLGALVLLFSILVPPVVAQTQELLKVLPQYLNIWEAYFETVAMRIPGLSEVIRPGQHSIVVALYEQAAGVVQGVLPKVFAGLHAAIDVFSVGVMAIYLALHPATYMDLVVSLFPPGHRAATRDTLHELGDTLRAFIVGQLLTMTVLGILTAIGLYILGAPYALTFGVFTGLVAIVPFFGTLLSTTLPALFVLTTPNGGVRALMVLGLGVVIHLIEGNVVAPMVMSRKVDLPPVLSILGVLIIGELLGPVGLLIAVPTICVVMVLVKRILLHGVYKTGDIVDGALAPVVISTAPPTAPPPPAS
ncbi:MAG TPA: AI-2E family transporter [Gemmatimonadaceae bacterium]|nr:AI-2E family transporter [Gemmatimonadaceae bacterium]